ncbi:unnamed protein product [Periconia digitata]|uniref:Uncharacterized protein n=1 Tax=Periconia digitata TaxID=1303443 RepID=A0A9W4XUS9_9PLEO|nr:unnamed protein product [Periconia digitata]
MADFVRGERVYFDFDSGGITGKVGPEQDEAPPVLASAFVGDILERPATVTAATPPVAPSFKTQVNGFPAHKKRTPRVSAFKQRREAQGRAAAEAQQAADTKVDEPSASVNADKERQQIDEENKQKLAAMTVGEIEEERNELLSSLPPSLIERLLQRGNIDEGRNEKEWEAEKPAGPPPSEIPKLDVISNTKPKPVGHKKVSFVEPEKAEETTPVAAHPPASASDPPSQPPAEATPTEREAATILEPDTGALHFPTPPQPPDLDPDDPAFLENLHTKYFPNLAYDPSQLSWMAPIDPSDKSSPYHPSQTAFNASDLRFDFKGNLLAPSTAREIPVSRGLHHHADAPEAAGYTIPELAVMARSAVPAQRCAAFQTLGRILYRLGIGEFGFEKVRPRSDGPVAQIIKDPNVEQEVDEDDIEVDMEDAGSAMAAGLWHCVEEGKVVETLTMEAAREKGHLTAKTFAQEALWNWRRGGGRKRQAV